MLRRLSSVALLLLGLVPAARAAQGEPVFSLRAEGNPKLGYFVYSLEPGATKSGAIIVANTGTAAGTVKLYAADGATGATTGTVYLTDRASRRAGTWITLERRALSLRPGGYLRVPFTVHVPANARPGQWVAGLVAEKERVAAGPHTKQKARVQIRIRDLTIVAVQVNVPGPARPAFSIGRVTTGGQRGFQQLLVSVDNAGNVLRKPRGSVVVGRDGGAAIERLPFRMDTFLPQTSVDYPLLLRKALGAGHYVARIRLSFPDAHGAATTVVAVRRFTISGGQVKQVFQSAPPTRRPAAAVGSGSSWALIGAIAAGGLVLVLLAVIVVLLRRTRSGGVESPETGSSEVRTR
jgi:hypothetical protein